MTAAAERVLVAGVGNVFFSDDGFGPAVIATLEADRLPAGVDVVDYGIRGVHLAYDLLEGRHKALVLVDSMPLGDEPGTLAVIEVEDRDAFGESLDAHSMSPAAVLAALAAVGASVGRVLVVGCQPGSLDAGMELSAPVAGALAEAARLVIDVAGDVAQDRAVTPAGPEPVPAPVGER